MANWKKGTQLNKGQYVIESMLLRASSGLAYKVKDKKTNQSVTIRTVNLINPNKDKEKAEKQQDLITQAIRVANIHHPNLVKIQPQVFEEDNRLYMVMEHIEGMDLASSLDNHGVFKEDDAIQIIGKIASALKVLHNQDCLHGELKPQNIIFRSDNSEPIVIDFGAAIELFSFGQKKGMKNLMDSFIPIEVIKNANDIGPYTDVYSLAGILYVLLTAQLPEPANSRQFKQLIPPKQLNSKISDKVNEAIIKGMELNISDRSRTIKQWLKLLPSVAKKEQNTANTNSGKEQNSLNINQSNSNTTVEPYTFDSVILENKSELFGLMSRVEQTLAPQTSEYFREQLDENTFIDMIVIPSGDMMMGSNSSEFERDKDEGPLHKIKVSSFYISKFPITQAQWRFVSNLPKISRSLNPNPSFFKGDLLPVERVSWYDAVEYCERLSQHTNKKYRLPTETEWEYACRAGTQTAFYFGDMINPDVANYDGRKTYRNSKTGKYEKKTTPVDSFPPNTFGIYDLHGNVWEWCEDHYASNYNSKPKDGTAYHSTMKNQPRLVRGGSWSLQPSSCRSAKRSSYAPDSNYNFVGFRIACFL